MTDYSSYRETPRTGRAPDQSMHELDPRPVDPSVLHDDRDNPDLLTFEKTWGHRMLAGLGIAMLIIAIVLAFYCVFKLLSFADYAAVLPEAGQIMLFWAIALTCAVALIPPAIVGIYVAKHPRGVMLAIIMAIIGLVLDGTFLVFALSTAPQFFVAAILYTALFAALPVAYLIAALKIKRSQDGIQ